MKKNGDAGEQRQNSGDYSDDRKKKQRRTEILAQAKEIVMHRFNMTEAEAHRYIQKSAMDSRKGMIEVSEMIIVLYGKE